MSAPAEIPKEWKHVSRPPLEALDPADYLSPEEIKEWDDWDSVMMQIEDRPAAAQAFLDRQKRREDDWKANDLLERTAQWRYAYADAAIDARGERGRVDDLTQMAQAILPALLQSHALRQPEDPEAEDLVGEGFELGWGAPGADVSFIDDHAGERASIAENMAFDAYLLAEAFISVRRRRYSC